MFKSYGDLSDVVSVVVYCQNDHSMMLTTEINEYYIPCIRTTPNASWSQSIAKEMFDVVGEVPIKSILRLIKVYMPGKAYVINCVYQMNVNAEGKNKSNNTQGKYRGRIKWANEQELTNLWTSKSLKTPEVYEYYYLAKGTNPPNYIQPEGNTLRGNALELCQNILITSRDTNLDNVVFAAEINKNSQEVIYKDFISCAFPGVLLGMQSFIKMISGFGWLKEDGPHLFRAADIKKRRGISFREFLYLIAALDPKTNLVGPLAEPRDLFIFCYFDKNGDNNLNTEEFKNFMTSSRKARKLPFDLPAVAKEVSETYKSLGLSEGANVTLNDFAKGAKDSRLKGLPQMLKSPFDISKYVSTKQAALTGGDTPNSGGGGAPTPPGRTPPPTPQQGRPPTPTQSGPAAQANYDSRATSGKDIELAVHTIKINKDSNQINVEELYGVQEAVSMNTLKRPPGTEPERKASFDVFSPKSLTNEVLKGVRYLSPLNKKLLTPNKNEKPTYNWGQLDPNIFLKNLIQVANLVANVFRREPRLLRLSSPTYVLGDLHGNIYDLLHFESTLWHLGANLCPCNLLLLGDYVDRGPFSIEVIAYLFSYKLQNPDKVHMLRGNHEIRDVQKMFTFYGECILKCGDKVGPELWNALNNAFDNMPIAAVVDNKIFCCHGGCPPPWLCPVISAINDIPVPLNQPNQQSSLAWEIMWNDPVKPKQVNDKLTMELMANEGFAVNARRGTAHVFSAEALDRFLKSNKLTHLLRAHEVVQAGYYIQQRGKIITVFSSSRYCGGDNEAACVLVDQAKLRILRLARS